MKTAIQILDEMIIMYNNIPEYQDETASCKAYALEKAKERIKKETGWINFEEVKPNEYDGCLLLTQDGEYCAGIWLSELSCGEIFFHFEDDAGNIIDNVAYFMPLPLPPHK